MAGVSGQWRKEPQLFCSSQTDLPLCGRKEVPAIITKWTLHLLKNVGAWLISAESVLSRRPLNFFEGKSASAMGAWLPNRVSGHWPTVGPGILLPAVECEFQRGSDSGV